MEVFISKELNFSLLTAETRRVPCGTQKQFRTVRLNKPQTMCPEAVESDGRDAKGFSEEMQIRT